MAKRPADVEKSMASSTSLVSAAKKTRGMEVTLVPCSTSDDLDVQVLRQQNRNLQIKRKAQKDVIKDLEERLEKAEMKKTTAEAIVFVINRYWNQLNEDVRILLQRFDAETLDETESQNEDNATTSFLNQLGSSFLSHWDSEEMSEQLQQRVDASTRAIMKVVQAFDRIVQRNSKITSALTEGDSSAAADLDEAVKQANVQLTTENRNLNILTTSLHERCRTLNLQISEANDRAESLEKENDELKGRIDDLEREVNQLRFRNEKLNINWKEALEKIKDLEAIAESTQDSITPSSSATSVNRGAKDKNHDSVSQSKVDELTKELEDQKELAANRLLELESLNTKHKDLLTEIEQLKMNLQCIPADVVKETAEYKCLQSHFSVLYNESMQLKAQLEETRQQLQTSKNNHLRQIEHMESEELSMQKRLRTEVIQLEDNLAQVRREYEMLRLEFEQVIAANEQTAPMTREMRNLITSLQNHNGQLKVEISRWKKKLKEAAHEIAKLKHENQQFIQQQQQTKNHVASSSQTQPSQPLICSQSSQSSCSGDGDSTPSTPTKGDLNLKLSQDIPEGSSLNKNDDGDIPPEVTGMCAPNLSIKKEPMDTDPLTAVGISTEDKNFKAFQELKNQMKELKTKHETLKGMYDSLLRQNKELKKQNAQLTASNNKADPSLTTNSNNTNANSDCKGLQQTPQNAVQPSTIPKGQEDLIAKLKAKIQTLEKVIASHKQQYQQQEEALLSEMEVTGSAFENMQETNVRLLQQLKEKDDANFKLMSERIKSQQIQKLLKEEKESLTEQVIALNAQVEAQNQVVRKLEEKERLLQNNLSTIEKELNLKQQAMEAHKRKAIEAAQNAADLKVHLDKYLSQLKEAQSAVAEKTSSLQEQSYKTSRLQEEGNILKRKYERAKKFEFVSAADEILQEENREYKAQLTCPSCQTRRKDAVLTRCFHVFCYECLKTRYESRQRKCPKCTQVFGANDYHKLYLA